jgi:excisionase family DNA binding protein
MLSHNTLLINSIKSFEGETIMKEKDAPIITQSDCLLTVREAARFLSVKTRTIYAWVQERRIPFRKVGRLLRFDRNELLSWSSEQAKDKPAQDLLRVINF